MATLAIGAALVAGTFLVYRYERIANQIRREDLVELNRWADTLKEISEIHDTFITLVDGANLSRDEQAIYVRGRALADKLDRLIQRIEAKGSAAAEAADGSAIRRVRDEIVAYRAASMTAVEMLTVNTALSATYRVKAALGLNRLNQEMAAYIEGRHDIIDRRLLARLSEVEQDAKRIGMALLIMSLLIILLIYRLTRKLIGNFDFIGTTLERLGKGQNDVVIEEHPEDTEFGRVITGLRKFQAALTDRNFAQQKLQAIFDSVLEAVVVIEASGKIIQTNPAVGSIFGYGADELLGRNVSILVGAEHASRHDDYLARYMRSKEAHIIGTVRTMKARRKGGAEFPIQLAVSQVKVGEVLYFAGVIADISEQVVQEELLRKARDQAEAANRTKSDFLAIMSHEIRTPMNGIIGMTDLALESSNDAERLGYLGIVKSSADTLLVIINDILDFSKIEAGKLQIESTGFDLRGQLGDVVASMQAQARAKGLQIGTHFASDIPARVIGDPVRLRQVLVNLIGNAIKFTGQGGLDVDVRLASRVAGTVTLQVMVRDSGIGIAADKLEHIFDAFTQADTSTTRKYGGTGLGLTISRQLAELMGGRMWIESEAGVGTSVYFTVALGIDPVASESPHVPAAPALRLAHAGPSVGQGSSPDGGMSVLLVEDHPVNQLLAIRLLEKSGHRVTTAENGEVALAHIAGGTHFDVVLMDMQMPVMGGLDATRAIREREKAAGLPRLRIVAMTANAMQGDREACLEAGMDDYLAKPIRPPELIAKLKPITA